MLPERLAGLAHGLDTCLARGNEMGERGMGRMRDEHSHLWQTQEEDRGGAEETPPEQLTLF